ncbi:MAG: hypothetical protein HXX81_07595 [Campylobacterales bacterium]|nr:hypothetical protein [Campylobacterales bacterium]
MKKRRVIENKNAFATLEKHLLSSHFSGIYLTNADFVDIAKKLDLEIGYKHRESILGELAEVAKELNKYELFLNLLIECLKNIEEKYNNLSNIYQNAKELFDEYNQKIAVMIKLINRELKSYDKTTIN